MSKIYFISDTHFQHENIIKYCNRPFQNVDEMNFTLIENWNNVVQKNDWIVHLGDFCFFNYLNDKSIFKKLNGKKVLIKGNHDHYKMMDELKSIFTCGIYDYAKLKNIIPSSTINAILFHYPIENWEGENKNLIHLHGHVHDNMEFISKSNRFNISVEKINYKPISLDEIISYINN